MAIMGRSVINVNSPPYISTAVEAVTPDYQVFIPLNERFGDTAMCPFTGIVQRLSVLGASAWIAAPEGRLAPGAATGEHLNIEALLSGEIPIPANNQGLIMTTVWTDTATGVTDVPTMSYGQSGVSQSGITFFASVLLKMTVRINNGDATFDPVKPTPPTLGADIPQTSSIHSATCVLSPILSDGTRTGELILDGISYDTVIFPATHTNFTAIENTLNMSSVNGTSKIHCGHWALFSTMPATSYNTYIGEWMKEYVVTYSATGVKSVFPLINGLPITNMELEYPVTNMAARDPMYAGAGTMNLVAPLKDPRNKTWIVVGDAINFSGTGYAVGSGIGAIGYNAALLDMGSAVTSKQIVCVLQQVSVGGGGISVLLRSNINVANVGLFRVFCAHTGGAGYNLSIEQLNGGFTWDVRATLAQTEDFETTSAVLNITDDGATITAWLNNDTAKLVSYASADQNGETYAGLYTEDGDGLETDCQWHDFAVFDLT